MIEESRRGFIGGVLSLLAAGPAAVRSLSSSMVGAAKPPIMLTPFYDTTPIFNGEIGIYNGVIIRESPQIEFNTALSGALRFTTPEDEDGLLPFSDEEDEALDDPDEWRDCCDDESREDLEDDD